MTMKRLLLTVGVLFSTQANALQYPATCRGPTATVAGIEGFDTPKAELVAIYTNPDMIAYCNYALRSENPEKKPDAAAVMKCAREFNETNGKTNLSVEANCKAGTMRMSELKEPIKMPVWTDCASRGQQIVVLSIELEKTTPILTVIIGVNLQAVYDALYAYEKAMAYSEYQSALKDVIMRGTRAQRIQTRAMILATGAQLIED